jgi:uncharacterized membrane protein
MKMVLIYVLTLVLFLAIDMVWLRGVARSTYVAEMGSLIRADVNLTAAIVFYFLYAAGLMYFAVLPAMEAKSIGQALLLGAGLGLVAYGTYDLTNLAVVNGFGTKIAMIDLAWGTVLSAISAALVVGIVSRIG